MNAVAMIDGGGIAASGFANWPDAGFELLERGCTVKGAAREFCKMF
jgi:hypothetical protein